MRRSCLIVAAVASAGTAYPAVARENSQGLRATAIAGLERTDSAPGLGARDGFYYGGQLGYDWDLGKVQLGIEGEVGGSTATDTIAGARVKQGVFANAAVRLAVPLAERMRVFARGGLAYHEIAGPGAGRFSGTGYTVGGGAEYDLSSRLLVRGEYRFSDYGNKVRGQHFLFGAGIRF